jgi:hypothetical protein
MRSVTIACVAVVFLAAAPAVGQTFTITVDATALTMPTFVVPGVGAQTFDTVVAQELELASGQYTFRAGGPCGIGFFPFTVTNTGTLEFDAALDGFASGRGGTTLVVDGFGISVDATALTEPTFVVPCVADPSDTATLLDIQVIPGEYMFRAGGPCGIGFFPFTVTNTGALDFDAAFDGFASGRGGTTLVVDGFGISVDATALTEPTFRVPCVADPSDTATLLDIQVIPGEYQFSTGGPCKNGFFPFTVTNTGTLEFDAALDGFASGRGGTTLVVDGFGISVDATALTEPTFQIPCVAGSLDTAELQLVQLIPGLYRMTTSSFGFDFYVVVVGGVDYGTFLDDVVLGRGTDFLVVLGDSEDPPTPEERIESLTVATETTDIPMVSGLVAILDRVSDAVASGDAEKVARRLNAYRHVLDGAISGDQIDPVTAQLLIARADSLERSLAE